MFLLDGKLINIYSSYTTSDGITYPHLRDATIRAALGIIEQPDPIRADDRFYWNGDVTMPKELEDRAEVDENGDPVYVQVLDNSDPANPVMVDTTEQLVTPGLKTTWTKQVKHTAGTMLSQSDWYVTRKAERDVAIPTSIADTRNAIRVECDRLEAAIAAATNINEFIAVVNDQRWPQDE